MVTVFAPNEVTPPIPRKKNCTMKHMKATIIPLRGPSKITTSGIINKCMGTPNGDGMDIEEAAIVTAARTEVLISILSFSSIFEILYMYMARKIIVKIQ